MFRITSLSTLLTALLFCSFLGQINAQEQEEAEKPKFQNDILIGFTYGYQLPGADLADRFGSNFYLGGNFNYVTKQHWLIGANVNYLFGNRPKEDVLRNIKTENGDILGDNGTLLFITQSERGYQIGLKAGRMIPLHNNGTRSGLRLELGVGFLQHKMRISAAEGAIPALSGDYIKGYDRLTNGLNISQFVGYQFFSTKSLVSFYAGFEFFQGFTKNRRTLNYDTGEADNDARVDLLNGFKVGWVLPIFRKTNKEYFY